jgi:hypothetical protein
VEVRSDSKQKMFFDLYSSTGHLVLRQTNEVLYGQQFISIPAEKLARGSYFLKVSDERNAIQKTIAVTLQ